MNNKQFSILQNYMILQFLLFLIGIFCTLQLAALPVEIPFSLPSLQKVDIRKVNNVEKQHEDNFDNEVQSFTKCVIVLYFKKNFYFNIILVINYYE